MLHGCGACCSLPYSLLFGVCCPYLCTHVPAALHLQVKARLAAKKKAAEAAAAKKKSIAAAAAAEAKARAKKAGGKKDTSHWNQAPTR
jgi:hypothetical protein